MKRKLVKAALMLVVCGIPAGAPAPASAVNDPDLTYPTGTLLETGSKLKAVNYGNIVITNKSQELIGFCSSAELTTTLTKNNGSEVEGEIETATFAGTGAEGACTPFLDFTADPTTNGLPWCLRSNGLMATDELQVRGNACSKEPRPIRLTTSFCTFERTTPMVGAYRTHSEEMSMSITFAEVEFQRTTGFCAPTLIFDMIFTVRADVPLGGPVYIS